MQYTTHPTLLANRGGLEIRITSGDIPSGVDVALCSSNERGTPGPLNTSVLRQIGLPPNALEPLGMQSSGWAWLQAPDGRAALNVVTIWEDRPAEALLRENLTRALGANRERLVKRTLWVPLMGAGGGRLTAEESFRIAVEVIGRAFGRDDEPPTRVWMSVGPNRQPVEHPWVLIALAALQEAGIEPVRTDIAEEPPAQTTSSSFLGQEVQSSGIQSPSPIPEPQGAAFTLELEAFHPSLSASLWKAARNGLDGPRIVAAVLEAVVLLAEPIEGAVARQLAGAFPQSLPKAANYPGETPYFPSAPTSSSITPDARAVLETAGQLTKDLGTQPIGWSALLASSLVQPDDHESIVFLRAQGVDPVVTLAALRATITASPSFPAREKWLAHPTVWKRIPKSAAHSPYAADTAEGTDRLGLEREVDALCRILLSKDNHPPLSLGLLGDWGTGKSFFMSQMVRRFKDLTLDQAERSIVHEIGVVRFNAWDYAGPSLWASLIVQIFDQLVATMAGKKKASPETRDEVAVALNRARKSAQDAVKVRDDAEKALHEAREGARLDVLLNAAEPSLAKLAKQMGLEPALASAADLSAAFRSLRSELQKSKQLFPRMTVAVRETRWLPVAGVLALCAAAAALWLGLEHLQWWDAAIRSIGAAAVPILVAAVPILTKVAKGIGTVNDTLARLDAGGDQSLLATSEKALAELAKAQAEIDRLERLDEEQNPVRRLLKFVEEKASNEGYRAEQGVLARVREDFEALSKRMQEWTPEQLDPMKAAGSPLHPVRRLVIFIDDLDRCPPRVVVDVLEAIHLLLALDLFIVVVAVDSRWLVRSLEVVYADLLTVKQDQAATDPDLFRASTPQSYLEKIFQIPFALGGMEKEPFQAYIKALAPLQAERPPDPGPPSSAAGSAPDAEQTPGSTDPTHPVEPIVGASPTPGERPPVEVRPTIPEKLEEIVHVTLDERAWLERLHPMIPTPRSAKRLVNVYSLLKATLPPERRMMFRLPNGPYPQVLVLFGILYGFPGLAHRVFTLLCEGLDDPGQKDLLDLMRPQPVKDKCPKNAFDPELTTAEDAEWKRLVRCLEGIEAPTNVQDYLEWAPRVARFSFITGHLWARHGARPPPTRPPSSIARPEAATKG